jgi:hypothetical protein
VPWCEDCSKFWNPNSMPPDGTCPTCGELIGEPPDSKVPWHFWLLIGALVIYLGYRMVQGFEWLVHNDHTSWAVLAGIGLVILVASAAAWNWWPAGDGADDAGGAA